MQALLNYMSAGIQNWNSSVTFSCDVLVSPGAGASVPVGWGRRTLTDPADDREDLLDTTMLVKWSTHLEKEL